MEQKKSLRLDVHERPSSLAAWVILSLQHVFAMFGATVLVPYLTGLPISVALFTSGLGTLLYILLTKAKVPVYLGSSFAYIGAIISTSVVTNTGIDFSAALTGLFFVGLTYVVVSIIIKFVGTGWVDKLLPPVIIGPMIIIIGMSLAGVAVSMAGFVPQTNSIDNSVYFDWRMMLTALTAFLITVLVSLKAKGFLKIVPFILGIVGGYLVAVMLNFINVPEGWTTLINYAPLWTSVSNPSQWLKIPEFIILGWDNGSVAIGSSTISFVAINFSAVLTIIPLALVTMAEHIGDHVVLGQITERNYLKDPGLHKTLLGDGLATSLAALLGGPANTTYGENTGVVAMTKVASTYVTGLAAIFAIILSFVYPFNVLISTIPSSVMGGISMILFGLIAGNGLKVMIEAKLNLFKTRNMIIVSTMLVIGLGGSSLPLGAVTFSGMALAAIIGILLNTFLPQENE